jgi:hypothetical protein
MILCLSTTQRKIRPRLRIYFVHGSISVTPTSRRLFRLRPFLLRLSPPTNRHQPVRITQTATHNSRPIRDKIPARLLLQRILRNYAGAAGSHMQPFFFGRRMARRGARFLIANARLEIAVTY